MKTFPWQQQLHIIVVDSTSTKLMSKSGASLPTMLPPLPLPPLPVEEPQPMASNKKSLGWTKLELWSCSYMTVSIYDIIIIYDYMSLISVHHNAHLKSCNYWQNHSESFVWPTHPTRFKWWFTIVCICKMFTLAPSSLVFNNQQTGVENIQSSKFSTQ